MVDIIRRMSIKGTSDGLDKVAADLRDVAAAQGEVADASKTTATVTDISSRKVLSAAAAYDRLRRSIDPVYQAQQKLVAAERTLQRAVDQGLISLAKRNELLEVARQRLSTPAGRIDVGFVKLGADAIANTRLLTGMGEAGQAAFAKIESSARRAAQATNLAASSTMLGGMSAVGGPRNVNLAASEHMIAGMSGAMDHFGASTRQASYLTKQLSFQLFDIAQGIPLLLASPLYGTMNLVTQAGQIKQLYIGQGGLKQAFADTKSAAVGLGASLLTGLSNPLGQVAIVAGVAAVAVGALFLRERSQAQSADEALKEHIDLISRIAKAYEGAGDSVNKYGMESKRVLESIDQSRRQTVQDQLNRTAIGISSGSELLTSLGAPGAESALLRLNAGAVSGAADWRKFGEEIVKALDNPRLNSAGRTTLETLRDMAAEQIRIQAAMEKRPFDQRREDILYSGGQRGAYAGVAHQRAIDAQALTAAYQAQLLSIRAISREEQIAAARAQARAEAMKDNFITAQETLAIERAGNLVAAQFDAAHYPRDERRAAILYSGGEQGELEKIRHQRQIDANAATLSYKAQLQSIHAIGIEEQVAAAQASARAQAMQDMIVTAKEELEILRAGNIVREQAQQTLANAQRDRIRSARDAVDSATVDTALIGQSIGQVTTLRANWQAYADLRREAEQNNLRDGQGNLIIDQGKLDALRAQNEELGRQIQLQARASLRGELSFDRSQMGRTGAERRVADAMRQLWGEDYPKFMGSAEAAQIRFNEELAKSVQRMDEIRGATKDTISTLLGGLESGKFGDSVASALEGIKGHLNDALAGTITKSLMGEQGQLGGGPIADFLSNLIPGLGGERGSSSANPLFVTFGDGAGGVGNIISDIFGGGQSGASGPGGVGNIIGDIFGGKSKGGGGVLDLIARAEGTGGNYNETLARGLLTGGKRNLTGMSLDQIDALQSGMLTNPANRWNSSAVGRYQITQRTLRGLRGEMGLSGSEMYDPQMQDMLAGRLLNRRGPNIPGLRSEWAGLSEGDASQIATMMKASGEKITGSLDQLGTGMQQSVSSFSPQFGGSLQKLLSLFGASGLSPAAFSIGMGGGPGGGAGLFGAETINSPPRFYTGGPAGGGGSKTEVHIHNNNGSKISVKQSQSGRGQQRIDVSTDEQVSAALKSDRSARTMSQQYGAGRRLERT